jgi:glutamate dehydrogenase (NAD(P)+)
MDLNCGAEDLREIYAGAGITLGNITDTSYFTAVSVRESVFAYHDWLRPSAQTIRLAIDGFGRVASHLIEMLPEEKFSVVAFSTSAGGRVAPAGFSRHALLSEKQVHGDRMAVTLKTGQPTSVEEVLWAEVDILLPSSRTWVLHDDNAPQVNARAVVPIANAPYSDAAVRLLQDRGVTCLPGFVTNAGGVFGSSLFDQGLSMQAVEAFAVRHYRPMVVRLLEESARRRVSPIELAKLLVDLELTARARSSRSNLGMGRRIARRVTTRFTPSRIRASTALRNLEGTMGAAIRGLGEGALA